MVAGIVILVANGGGTVINYLGMRWRIWWLHREQRSLEKFYGKKLDAVREAKGSADDRASVESTHRWEDEMVTDKIYREHTVYLTKLAQTLMVPTPKWGSDRWEDSSQMGFRYLNREGLKELRTAIRAERKESREMWVPLVAGSTGVLGALTGLVAVFVKAKGGG
jgi:hypothetical protein